MADHYRQWHGGHVSARWTFELAPSNGGTDFVASLDVRFAAMAERLLKRQVAALRAHMHEEGVNLKRLLET